MVSGKALKGENDKLSTDISHPAGAPEWQGHLGRDGARARRSRHDCQPNALDILFLEKRRGLAVRQSRGWLRAKLCGLDVSKSSNTHPNHAPIPTACHPERSEGSAVVRLGPELQILRCAQDDRWRGWFGTLAGAERSSAVLMYQSSATRTAWLCAVPTSWHGHLGRDQTRAGRPCHDSQARRGGACPTHCCRSGR